MCPKLSKFMQKFNLDKMAFFIFTRHCEKWQNYKIEQVLGEKFADLHNIMKELYNFSHESCDKLLKIVDNNLSKTGLKMIEKHVKVRKTTVILNSLELNINVNSSLMKIVQAFDESKEEIEDNRKVFKYDFVVAYWNKHKIAMKEEGLVKLTDDPEVDLSDVENNLGIAIKYNSIFTMYFSILNNASGDQFDLFVIMNMILLK
jgi:hypothetical protein